MEQNQISIYWKINIFHAWKTMIIIFFLQNFYMRVTKVPDTLLSAFQLDAKKLQPTLSQWVKFEGAGLNSQSSQLLSSSSKETKMDQRLVDFYNQKVIPQMQLSEETIKGEALYHLHLTPTNDLIDQFANLSEQIGNTQTPSVSNTTLQVNQTKLSDYIKGMTIDLWVDQQSYLITRVSTTMTMLPTALPSVPTQVLGASTIFSRSDILGTLTSTAKQVSSSPVEIAMVGTFNDFNKDFTVEEPTTYLTTQQYLQQIEASSPTLSALQSPAVKSKSSTSSKGLSQSVTPSATPTPAPVDTHLSASKTMIEPGIYATITQATDLGTTMKIHIIFTNTTSTTQSVKIAVSMLGPKLGTGTLEGYLYDTFAPSETKAYDMTYTKYESPPYRWIWGGPGDIILGTYNP